MSTIAGIGGNLNGVSQFQQFSATSTANLQEFVHAGSGIGGRQRRPGIKDWNASYNSYGHTPDYWPGDPITFTGSIDGAVGIAGPALVITQAITWTPEGNLPITHVGNVSATGLLVRGAAVVAEPAPSEPAMSDQVCVQLATDFATPVYVKEEDCRTITLTLSVQPNEYSSCSTGGTMGRVNSLWDVALTYDVYTDDFALLPDEGEPYAVEIETVLGSANTYNLDWMRVSELSNLLTNRQTGELVGATVNMVASSVENVTATPTIGQFLKPDASVWMPPPAVILAARAEARNEFVLARREARKMTLDGKPEEGLILVMDATDRGHKMVAEAVETLRQKGVERNELVSKAEENTSA